MIVKYEWWSKDDVIPCSWSIAQERNLSWNMPKSSLNNEKVKMKIGIYFYLCNCIDFLKWIGFTSDVNYNHELKL